jgi:6-pyruvoyl-tetrahydropterin synthase
VWSHVQALTVMRRPLAPCHAHKYQTRVKVTDPDTPLSDFGHNLVTQFTLKSNHKKLNWNWNSKGRLRALLINIRLGWKGVAVTNGLDYSTVKILYCIAEPVS